MSDKAREARRVEAVRRLEAGDSAQAVAASLGVAPHTVYAWGKLAREDGVQVLKAKSRSGRPRKLDKTHWPELRRKVLDGPRSAGFDRDLWTLPMIRELILMEFGVLYHDDHLSRLMRQLGLSRQKPAVRAIERDEQAIQRFVDVEFPALEKKRERVAER